MMKTTTVEVVSGKIGSDGTVYQGILSCRRDAVGRYKMHAPPGRRLLSLAPVSTDPTVWTLVQTAQFYGYTCLVILANENGSANVDQNFSYIAMLAT